MSEYVVGKTYNCVPVIISDALIKLTKNGNKFLTCRLYDSDGDMISAKKWNDIPTEMYLDATVGRVMLVDFVADSFNNEIQANIKNMIFASEGKYDISDFKPKYIQDKDVAAYINAVEGLIKKINDNELQEFVRLIFDDLGLFNKDEDVLKSEFVTATAAVKHHHVGYGGLLVHSYNVAAKAFYASVAYSKKYCDPDYCIAGGLLHDIGKLVSYSTKDIAISMTIPGIIIGHTALGVAYLERYRDKLSEGKLAFLQHIIASHHGRTEYDAIREPMSLEALLVSQADMGDMYETVLHENRDLPITGGDLKIGNNNYLLSINRRNSLIHTTDTTTTD